MAQNCALDVSVNDFGALLDEDVSLGAGVSAGLKEFQSFTDIVYSKNKCVSAIDWHPAGNGVVAVACTDKGQRERSPPHRRPPPLTSLFYSNLRRARAGRWQRAPPPPKNLHRRTHTPPPRSPSPTSWSGPSRTLSTQNSSLSRREIASRSASTRRIQISSLQVHPFTTRLSHSLYLLPPHNRLHKRPCSVVGPLQNIIRRP
jgi:hypothetical protein